MPNTSIPSRDELDDLIFRLVTEDDAMAPQTALWTLAAFQDSREFSKLLYAVVMSAQATQENPSETLAKVAAMAFTWGQLWERERSAATLATSRSERIAAALAKARGIALVLLEDEAENPGTGYDSQTGIDLATAVKDLEVEP